MLFGIKLFENKIGLKKVNESLNKYGSAIMFSGKNTGIFLTNPMEALKVACTLNKRSQIIKYKVYKLKEWEISRIDRKDIVKTYKEYIQLEEERHAETTRKLEKMLKESGLSKPQKDILEK